MLSANKWLFIFVFALLSSAATANAQHTPLSGQWHGSWESCTTGHRGRLHASFCRIDAQHVQANFSGTFAKIIPFRYRPVLNIVHEEPGLLIMQGSKRLPLMGNFHYHATVSGNEFNATYRTRRDQGVWRMRR